MKMKYYIIFYGEMMMTYTNLKSLCLAITMLAILPLSDAFSQNFIQASTGTYNATFKGVIKLNNIAGKIDNSSTNILGTIAKPVPGVVHYAATAGTQVVLGSSSTGGVFYYTSLFLNGASTKTIEGGIFVVGNAIAATTALAGYTALETYPYVGTGGARTFAGLFTYAGTNQNIYPESDNSGTTNNYNSLALTGAGTKTVLTTETVLVRNAISSIVGSNLLVNGTLNTGASASELAGNVAITGLLVGTPAKIQVGAGEITFAGTLDLTDYSTLNGGAGGVVTSGVTTIDGTLALVNVESGNITFDGNLALTEGTLLAADGALGTAIIGATSDATIAQLGLLDFGIATNLQISGDATNSGNGTNLTFDSLSTVLYNGALAQSILATPITNKYGFLNIEGAGLKTAAGNIYIANNFSLANNNLVMGANTLYMTGLTRTATYAGVVEVTGAFNRVTNGIGRTYTLNNTLTEVTLATAATNPTSIQTYIMPNTNPEQYVGTTDVKRKITYTYTGNSGAFIYDMKVGYLYSEGPTDGTLWGNLSTQESLRMYEANAAPDGIEKVITGNTPVKTPASTGPPVVMGSFKLTGIGSTAATLLPNGVGLFASTNDVLLRAGPTTFYSIQAGRWTNPNTWDEGTIPTEDDNAEIRHLVYAGIPGPFAGTPGDPSNITTELSVYGTDPAINKIVISGDALYAGNKPSFVLGNMDNGAGFVFKTKLTTGTAFTNNNTAAPVTAFNATTGILATYATSTTAGITPASFNGFWVVGWTGGPSVGIPQFKTNQIDNKGTINNEGIIDIGQ